MGRAGAAEPSGPWLESVATAAGRPWSGWGGRLALEPASLTGCSPHPVVDGDPAGTEVDHGDQGSGAVIAVAGIVDQAVLALGPFEARDRPGRARRRRGRVPDRFARSWLPSPQGSGPTPRRGASKAALAGAGSSARRPPQPHQGRPAAVATDSSHGPDGSAAPARPATPPPPSARLKPFNGPSAPLPSGSPDDEGHIPPTAGRQPASAHESPRRTGSGRIRSQTG